jgi:hypothetical protein
VSDLCQRLCAVASTLAIRAECARLVQADACSTTRCDTTTNTSSNRRGTTTTTTTRVSTITTVSACRRKLPDTTGASDATGTADTSVTTEVGGARACAERATEASAGDHTSDTASCRRVEGATPTFPSAEPAEHLMDDHAVDTDRRCATVGAGQTGSAVRASHTVAARRCSSTSSTICR